MKQFRVQKDALCIDVTYTGVIRAHFRGRSALPQPETVLVPLFDQLAGDAVQGALLVDLHFEDLEFFNSVTISCLIQCVLAMRDKGVRTSIRYDKRQQWQRAFFEALGMLRGSTGNLDIKAV